MKLQTLISDPPSQSLLGAYLNYVKFGNLTSYKAQASVIIEGNVYRIEQKVRFIVVTMCPSPSWALLCSRRNHSSRLTELDFF
jgi:hypothetical protein